MLCMACGAEMRLMQVVEDDTMMVPGYEHHTFMCPTCGEIERRLIFCSQSTPRDTAPLDAVSNVAPASIQNDRVSTWSSWARALTKLRRASRH
jgi:hypothetical protein